MEIKSVNQGNLGVDSGTMGIFPLSKLEGKLSFEVLKDIRAIEASFKYAPAVDTPRQKKTITLVQVPIEYYRGSTTTVMMAYIPQGVGYIETSKDHISLCSDGEEDEGFESHWFVISDPCYILTEDAYSVFLKESGEQGWGSEIELDFGIIQPTLWGDGEYPVIKTCWDTVVVSFEDEEDDEDDDDDYYELTEDDEDF